MEGDTFEVWGVVLFSVRDHDRVAGLGIGFGRASEEGGHAV